MLASIGRIISEAQFKSTRDFIRVNVTSNTHLTVLLICSTWMLTGILFYKYIHNWTFYNSFFYVIDSGMSIGFGNVAEMDNDGVHVFTILLVLSGSTIVSGAIGYFLTFLIYENNLVDPEIYDLNTVPFHDSSGKIGFLSVLRSLWYKSKYLVGWYTQNRALIKSLYIFALWMALGIIYGMVYEDWSFVTSFYFSVSTCSTAGLLGPPCNDPNTTDTQYCDLGIVRASLAGIYAMFGVPSKSFDGSMFLSFFSFFIFIL